VVLAEADEQIVDAWRRAESAAVPHVIVELGSGIDSADQEIRAADVRRAWETRGMSTRRATVGNAPWARQLWWPSPRMPRGDGPDGPAWGGDERTAPRETAPRG
jgi:hypothetical protein